MSRRKSLSDIGVAALKPRAARYAEPDPELRGHYVGCSRAARSHLSRWPAIRTANRFGRRSAQPMFSASRTPAHRRDPSSSASARDYRHSRRRRPSPTPSRRLPTTGSSDTFRERAALREADQGASSTHMFFRSGRDREFLAIRRSDVAALLDDVEDNHSADPGRSRPHHRAQHHELVCDAPAMTTRRRSSAACAGRTPKPKRGRGSSTTTSSARSGAPQRRAAPSAPLSPALLTAQRSRKIASDEMGRPLDGDVWTIPKEPREKDTAGTLVLPDVAVDIIEAQPRLASNPYVFAGRREEPSTTSRKARRHSTRNCRPMSGWVIHDLRRTARSLMSRAGVRPDIAERVLGACHRRRRGGLRSALLPRREGRRVAAARDADRQYRRSAGKCDAADAKDFDLVTLPATYDEAVAAEALAYARAEVVFYRNSANPWSANSPLSPEASRAFTRWVMTWSTQFPLSRLRLIDLARLGDPDAHTVLCTVIVEMTSRREELPTELAAYNMEVVARQGRLLPQWPAPDARASSFATSAFP